MTSSERTRAALTSSQKGTAAALGPAHSRVASDRRLFIRFQLKVMTHRHDAQREKSMGTQYTRDLSLRDSINALH